MKQIDVKFTKPQLRRVLALYSKFGWIEKKAQLVCSTLYADKLTITANDSRGQTVLICSPREVKLIVAQDWKGLELLIQVFRSRNQTKAAIKATEAAKQAYKYALLAYREHRK